MDNNEDKNENVREFLSLVRKFKSQLSFIGIKVGHIPMEAQTSDGLRVLRKIQDLKNLTTPQSNIFDLSTRKQ